MKKLRRPSEELTVHVKGKNMTITPALHDVVVNKMGRLAKYLDRLQAIEVELRTEKTREAAHQNCVEATTRVRGATIRVESTNEAMVAAIDDAVDKLYRKLNRQKERMKSHHGERLAEALPGDETALEPDVGPSESAAQRGNGGSPVVQIERLDVEP